MSGARDTIPSVLQILQVALIYVVLVYLAGFVFGAA